MIRTRNLLMAFVINLFLILFVFLILFTNHSYSQTPTPPPFPAPQDPQVALLGDHKKPGNTAVLIIKTTGTIGQDPKITVTPASAQWQALKSLDGELLIMFFENKEGVYVIALAVNLNNKTALAAHDIVVSSPNPSPGPIPPGPGPGPTPPVPPVNPDLVSKFSAAFQVDAPKTTNPQQMKIQLIALFREMAKINTGTWRQLQTTLSESTKKFIGDSLPTVKAQATTYILTKFPRSGGDQTVDPVIVASVFTDLANALAASAN